MLLTWQLRATNLAFNLHRSNVCSHCRQVEAVPHVQVRGSCSSCKHEWERGSGQLVFNLPRELGAHAAHPNWLARRCAALILTICNPGLPSFAPRSYILRELPQVLRTLPGLDLDNVRGGGGAREGEGRGSVWFVPLWDGLGCFV